jgi:hypothetical protein
MTQPERPPISWGRTLKILALVFGLGLVVFFIVVEVLLRTGHLAT